jgi:hypothetical protein
VREQVVQPLRVDVQRKCNCSRGIRAQLTNILFREEFSAVSQSLVIGKTYNNRIFRTAPSCRVRYRPKVSRCEKRTEPVQIAVQYSPHLGIARSKSWRKQCV